MSKAGPWLAILRSCSLKMPSDPEKVSELDRDDDEGWLDKLLLAADEKERLGVSNPPA